MYLMNRFQLLCLEVITFLAFAQDQEFMSVDLKNGNAKFSIGRSLDALTNTTIPSVSSSYHFDLAVYADLGVEYRHQQSLSDNATILMQIFISESQSGLNAADSTCHTFLGGQYNCQAPLCAEIPSSSQTINYSLISSSNVTSLKLNSPGAISIADGSWQLNTTDFLYIHNCHAISSAVSASGWIGLGLSGNGASNFKAANPIFSLLVNSSLGFSQLIFGYNSSYVDSSKPAIILNSDPDWKVNVSGVSFGNISSNFTQGIPLVFEVGLKKMVFPQPQAGEIISHLSKYPGMKCGVGLYYNYDMNSCFFDGDLSTLPMLEFSLANGTAFSIPASAYLFNKTDSQSELIEYVTEFETFDPALGIENVIIIGMNVLSHYYSVFRQLSPGINTITLYPLPENFNGNSASSAASSTPNNSSPSSNSTITIPDPIADNTGSNDSTGINSNDSSDPAAILIIVIVIVLTVVFVGFLGHKRGWWLRSKSFSGEGNMNLELRRNEMTEEVSDNVMYSL